MQLDQVVGLAANAIDNINQLNEVDPPLGHAPSCTKCPDKEHSFDILSNLIVPFYAKEQDPRYDRPV